METRRGGKGTGTCSLRIDSSVRGNGRLSFSSAADGERWVNWVGTGLLRDLLTGVADRPGKRWEHRLIAAEIDMRGVLDGEWRQRLADLMELRAVELFAAAHQPHAILHEG